MAQRFDYDVFFSYRHKNLDNIITQKTFHFLEGYRLPASLRRKGYQDIRRAFRDTEELPVSRVLSDTIDKALRATNCLIVVCSTDTPSSEWVDREVETFIELGRAEHVYPLLISGDPETSFPPCLKRVPDIMERVIDIRIPGNPVKKMLAKEDTELLKVIADVAGCPLPELQREHKLRKAHRFAAGAAAAAAVFFLVGAVSLGLMNRAQDYREQAQAAEHSSMQVLEELTYGLPDKLTGVPGAYSKISGILKDNASQINEILLLSTDKTDAQYQVAANYEKLATAMGVLGSFGEAVDYQQQAIRLYESLCQTDGDMGPLASARNNYGKILNAAGRFEEAAVAFQDAIALRKEGGDDPVELAAMLTNAGANAVSLGQDAEAIEFFRECRQLLDEVDDRDYNTLLIGTNNNYNYGTLLYRRGEYANAETLLVQAIDGYSTLCGRVDSPENRNLLAKGRSGLALCLADQGRYEEAVAEYQEAIQSAETLVADAENTEAMATLAMLYNNCGLCMNAQGKFADADPYYSAAAQLYGQISRTTGSAEDAAVYATACLNTGENAFKAGQYDISKAQFEEGLGVYAGAVTELGDYYTSQYYAWASYAALIHDRDYEAAVDYGVAAVRLQPGNVLANLNLGYACLYAGYYDDCDQLLTWVAGLGEGQADVIRLDLDAQARAGLHSDHTDALLDLLP
ncbi:MAG: tetratricopeptide repeat protein [Candidatus Limivicinus sp.]